MAKTLVQQKREVDALAQCVACGCTDLKACPGGCYWAGLNPETHDGICSRCAVRPLDDLMAAIGFAKMTKEEALTRLLAGETLTTGDPAIYR
jgi:hypothetical protein